MPRRRWPQLTMVGMVAVVGAVVGLRLAVVASYRSAAGDGHQYYWLAQSLVREGRYSYGRSPTSLTYTRLPGYPAFLAYVVDRGAVTLPVHLKRATVANVILDLGTALLVLWMVRRHWPRRGAGAIALVGVLVSPLLIRLSCYGLTESLATFLTALEIALALQASRQRPILFAGLAGVVAGVAQLVRADALAALPAAVLALLWIAPARRRWAAVAAFSLAAAAAFAPWPTRNLARFGRPHFFGAEWLAADGSELPTGAVRWMRTWSSMASGESDLNVRLVNGWRCDADNVLLSMYDSDEERREVRDLLRRYNRESLSAAVNEGFLRLADARSRREPVRTYVVLPSRRLVALWQSMSDYELPLRSPLLSVPRRSYVFGWWDGGTYLLALLGAIVLVRGGRASPQLRLVAVLACAVACRSLLHCWAVPHATNQRYLAEVMPFLVALAACGAAWLASFARDHLRRRRAPVAPAAAPAPVAPPPVQDGELT